MRGFGIGSGDSGSFKSGNYIGVRLVAYLRHVTVNTAFAGVVFDWTKVIAKLTLLRGGKSIEIFSEQVLPLALATGFYGGTFDEVKGGGTPFLRKLVAAAAGTDEELMITAKINLPGIINLMDGDELKFEVKCDSSAVNAAYVSIPESNIQWELIEGVGNSTQIPKIQVKMISGGQSSDNVELGDNIAYVAFINNDKFSPLTSDKVLDSIAFKSDKLTRDDDYPELLTDRSNKFSTATLADQRNQCFILGSIDDAKCDVMGDATDIVRLHNVRIKLQMIPGNVNNAKNYVVGVGFIADNDTLQASLERNARHSTANAAQLVG